MLHSRNLYQSGFPKISSVHKKINWYFLDFQSLKRITIKSLFFRGSSIDDSNINQQIISPDKTHSIFPATLKIPYQISDLETKNASGCKAFLVIFCAFLSQKQCERQDRIAINF